MAGPPPSAASAVNAAAEARAGTRERIRPWIHEYIQRHGLEDTSKAHAAFAAFGLYGLEVPEDYGGSGLARGDTMRAMETLGAIDLSLAVDAVIHYNVTQALARHGSASQKRRYLTPIVAGHKSAAFSLTEPGAGSNLRGIEAYAEEVEGGYALKGEKSWCGGAGRADVILVLARVERGGPLTAFLVDRSAPGVFVHAPHDLVGAAGVSVSDISLRSVFVPRQDVLGEVGHGFRVVGDALSAARLAIAAISLGAMKRALQWICRYAKRRSIGSGRLIDNEVFRAWLHEATIAALSVDALLTKTCAALDRGEEVPLAAILACKVAATEWLGVIADAFVQWLGARGYHARSPAGRLYRDYRLLRIGEGPTEALLAHLGSLVSTELEATRAFMASALDAGDVATGLGDVGGTIDPRGGVELLGASRGALIVAELLAAAVADRQDALSFWKARIESLEREARRRMGIALPEAAALDATVTAFDRDVGSLGETVAPEHRSEDPYLSEQGRERGSAPSSRDLAIIRSWERGGDAPDVTAHVHQLIEAVAKRTPSAPAVYADDEVLSYAELDARANRLASALQRRGVTPGSFVPVLVRRNPWLVVASLGVMKSGAVVVPLDPASPADRIRRLLGQLAHACVVSERALEGLAAGLGVLCVDSLSGDADVRQVALAPDAPALVIHTSGSTGRRKPVLLGHHGLATMLLCRQTLSPLGASDRVLQCAAPTFDISFWEYAAPLIAGACVVTPARPGGEWDGAEIVARIRDLAITTLQTLPTPLSDILAHAKPGDLSSLRRIYCGGEPMTRALAARVAKLTSATLINMYGPTETTIECTWYVCNDSGMGAVPPIGRPIPGRSIYLLDDERRRVPIGEKGEIYIGGVGVAHGYAGDAEATEKAFVPDPFSSSAGARMYKSGDLGCYRDDGNIQFLGRADRQLKIRGVRVEPGEIEQVLLEHADVSQAFASAVDRGDDGKVLVAYVVPRPGASLCEEELLSHARQKLPRGLVPAAISVLADMPRTTTGKVDPGALPKIDWSRTLRAPRPAGNATEEALLGLLTEHLDAHHIGLDDDFFALGGHSLAGARVLSAVRDRFGCQIRLDDFLSNPTVRWLALAVDSAANAEPASAVREVPLSLYDASRARSIPALVYLPDGTGAHPVVLFSHGLGGSREGYRYLGRHWALHGYASVHLQHAGSDIEVLLAAKNPMLNAMHVTSDRRHLMQRPLDVSFALSELERLESRHTALRGRLDLTRAGVAGHSFGAFTALAVAGMTIDAGDGVAQRFFDPRIKAAVALSPPALFGGALSASSYRSVERPCLHASGTNDDGPVFRITPDERRFSYVSTPPPDQYFVMIEGAHHFTFGDNARWNGEAVRRDPVHHDLLRALTTAFWDAHLRDDEIARRWLRGDAAKAWRAHAEIEHK